MLIIDPFKIFNIEYVFEIEDLDRKYYELFKKSEDQATINNAYKILKDDIMRIEYLCKYYNYNENIDLSIIFECKKQTKEDIIEFYKKYLQLAIQAAKIQNWKEANQYIKHVIYLKK